MNSREYARQERIKETIKFLHEEMLKGEKIDRKKYILALMLKYNVSRKTAIDYFDIAFFTQNELA